MSDYLYGSEPYFLERIDTNISATLNDIRELLLLEREATEHLRELRQERKDDAQAKLDTEITEIFGKTVSLSRRVDVLQDYIERLDSALLASLARALTITQDVIHEETIKRSKSNEQTPVNDSVSVGIKPL